jgi:hypothetical protein
MPGSFAEWKQSESFVLNLTRVLLMCRNFDGIIDQNNGIGLISAQLDQPAG